MKTEIKYWLMKLASKFRKHNFIDTGIRATCYHQKNSKITKCDKCGLTGFVSKDQEAKILNRYGCNGSKQ